jgi:hypothetical protein
MLTAELLDSLGVAPLGDAGAGGAGNPVLAVPTPLVPLFPGGGLRRGSTLTVRGSSSLVLALVAAVSRGMVSGGTVSAGWCAEVGSPLLGSAAAAEAGVVLERFIRIAEPGEQWASVVASLLEAFTLVVVHPPARANVGDTRRLSARARERGAVLLSTGGWDGASLALSVTRQRWVGLGQGHGYLRSREVEVQATGRGAAARPHVVRVWLPGADGAVSPVPPAREDAA